MTKTGKRSKRVMTAAFAVVLAAAVTFSMAA